MESPNPRNEATWGWPTLPVEIRHDILDFYLQDRAPGWTVPAAVCEEWRRYIGRINFAKLKVRASQLKDLEKSLIRERDLVGHIQLHIRLPTFTCSCMTCWTARGVRTPLREGRRVDDGIGRLYKMLSSWPASGHLTLELNANSPTDRDVFPKEFCFDSDCETSEELATEDLERADQPSRDLIHYYHNGGEPSSIRFPGDNKKQLFKIIGPRFMIRNRVPWGGNPLPEVKAVKSFVIRRQMRRGLDGQALAYMLERLVCLERVHLETWRPYEEKFGQRKYDDLTHVLSVMPSLKRLTVFEDHNLILTNQPRVHWRPSALARIQIGMSLEIASMASRLEHLSVSNVIDAEYCFRACSEQSWPQLQTLALTSRRLRESQPFEDLENLMTRTAQFAMRIPKLQALALWNAGEWHANEAGSKGRWKNAGTFIFETGRYKAMMTWVGTWVPLRSIQAKKAWEEVSLMLNKCGISSKSRNLECLIESHGDAIHHLNLPMQVVHPASLWQIRKELRKTEA